MSVKCVLLTDKSAKNGALSVNLSKISVRRPEQEKIRAITGTDLKSSFSCGAWSSKACVRGHKRSAPHLANWVQTSDKAHDKFVSRRDCACADHSHPSLSPALLGGRSSHLVLIRFRLTAPLSQAPLLGQDELTRRKRNLDTRGLSVRLHTLHFNPHHTIITIKQINETSEFAISRSYREVKQLRITDRNSSVR